MLLSRLCLGSAALLALACLTAAAIDKRITAGLQAGESLLAEVTEEAFPVLLESIVPWTMAFMKALELLVTVAAQDDQSREAEQFRQLFHEYNARLRVMSLEFSEVRAQIDWTTVKAGFGEYERTIIALKQNIAMVLNAPEGTRAEQKRYFTTQFESDYKNAGSKLYNSLVDHNLLFSDNLIRAVRHYTRDNRSLVRHFLMGAYKLILEAIELESTYLVFNNFSSSADYVEQHWVTRLEKLKSVYATVDKEIEANWANQSSLDIDNFAQHKYTLGLNDYAKQLHGHLSKKFWWRSWLVLAYDPVWTFNKHAIGSCNTTVIRFRQQGKNIVVSSVDRKTAPKFNAADAKRILNTMDKKTPAWQKDKPLYFLHGLMAAAKITEEGCPTYAMTAVLVNEANHALAVDPGHSVYQVHSAKAIIHTYKFKAFIFG